MSQMLRNQLNRAVRDADEQDDTACHFFDAVPDGIADGGVEAVFTLLDEAGEVHTLADGLVAFWQDCKAWVVRDGKLTVVKVDDDTPFAVPLKSDVKKGDVVTIVYINGQPVEAY